MTELTPGELKYLVARQREEIKTINDVGRLLRSTTDPHEIVRLVASYLKQTFPIALCGILMVDRNQLHMVRFAPIAQVDMTAAIRQLLNSAREKLQQNVREEAITPVIEDQFGQAGQTIGTLRSHVTIPLSFNGQAVGLLGVFSGQADALGKEDAHAIEIVADQLRAALHNALLVDKLRQADRLKNDLLAIISHELRIPLTVIREGVNLLQEEALGPTNPEQKEFLGTVYQNVERLQQLLDKVLAATQVVTGGIPFRFASVEMGPLLDQTAAAFRPVAESKKVTLELVRPVQSLRWTVDAERLKQAFGHLIENGIQATPPEGRVTVSCSVTSAGMLEIQVNDTGTGIPAEEIPRLFEQFRSIGGIHERKTGGLGLGLFITKALIDAHQGTVRVESQVGRGTRVSVQLPKDPTA